MKIKVFRGMSYLSSEFFKSLKFDVRADKASGDIDEQKTDFA